MRVMSKTMLLFALIALLLWACGGDSGSTDGGSDTVCEPDGTGKTDEVQQPGTDLYWKRCPLGQDWDEEDSCGYTADAPDRVTWCYAMNLEPGDSQDGPCYNNPEPAENVDICETEYGAGYRLPTRQEFVELLGNCSDDVLNGAFGYCDTCETSTNCTNMFGPDTLFYWSSSSYDDDLAWKATFGLGSLDVAQKDPWPEGFVRCVRTGP
ncbi:MAG: DUF1566 domain-containing protein [Proteobacteria bacterium]|nr:DUF1566 domain-containing protein [Pseudomonadota bacterium]